MRVNADALLDACDIAVSLGTFGISVIPKEDGWELWTRADSRIAAVYAKITAEAFPDGYTQGDCFIIRHRFIQEAVLRGAEPDIAVEGGRLTVVDGRRRQSVRLDGLDAYDAVKVMPTYTPEATMAIMSDELKAFFRQRQLKDFTGETGIRLIMTAEGLTARAEDTLTSFEDFLPCDAVTLPEGIDSVRARFTTGVLIPLIMAMPKGALVTLGFDSDSPIELTVSTEELQARLLLAPMIAEGDE